MLKNNYSVHYEQKIRNIKKSNGTPRYRRCTLIIGTLEKYEKSVFLRQAHVVAHFSHNSVRLRLTRELSEILRKLDHARHVAAHVLSRKHAREERLRHKKQTERDMTMINKRSNN